MTDSKILKLLLVEDDLEDEQLLCEALNEIEETQRWGIWRSASIVHVDDLADALECLNKEKFDAVLLNLSLPDSPALLDSFLEANACARGTPIVVLADEEDESLANRLLREGAQDIFLKRELDSAPLARSLRYAIERQRRAHAFRSSPFVDHLTGALTRTGFLTIAEHYVRLSACNHTDLVLASLAIPDLPQGSPGDREARDLLLVRASELLRATFDPPALAGRIELCRFAVMTAGFKETTVEALLNRAAAEIEYAGCEGRQLTTVRFSVMTLIPGDSVEELLGRDGTPPAEKSRWHTKTVMLAD